MRKEEARFITGFFSEAGIRKKNCDFFGYVELDNYAIWAVSDGYDEEEGAEVAARTAVEAAVEYFMLYPRFNWEAVKELMEYANKKVKEKQEETERYSLMHSSLLVVISNYSSILYGNVGNTRLYHIRNGYIDYRSRDDTIAQLLVEEEALDIRDVKYHRQRGDLLQAIGDYSAVRPYILKSPLELQENDTFCLTTSGFWENIDEREMEVELSRQENQSQWIISMKRKIMAAPRNEVGNHTFVAVNIKGTAAHEPMESRKGKKFLKLLAVGIVVLLIVIIVATWQWKVRRDIVRRAIEYEQKADEEIIKKNFANSLEELKLSIGEYERLKSKATGIAGFFLNSRGRNADADNRIGEVKKKIGHTDKLQKAFLNISQGNELFNNGKYEEASRKYQEAKYALEENAYKKDELNIEEVLIELKARIDSSGKLKEALLIEQAGDIAMAEGNYSMARTSYKDAADRYLANGRADYGAIVEEKISEINDKEKSAYSNAAISENKGDILSSIDSNISREAYYEARAVYQTLGDSAKVSEIDMKIQELNARHLSNLQTANNLVQEGLNQITANNPAEAISLLTKAKGMYQGLKDEGNASNVDSFIRQAQEFIKFESVKEEELNRQKQETEAQIKAKEDELRLKEEEIKAEKERREKIAENIEEATGLEIQADQLQILERYAESIVKYEEARKIFSQLKEAGDFDDQTSKIDYLGRKITKVESFLYEEQGDASVKEKDWNEAEKKYRMAKEKMENSDVNQEDRERIEKKLKKAEKKAKKKWWEFWK